MEVMDYECSSSPIPKHPACSDARLTTPTHPVHTRWSSLPEELWLKVFTCLEPLDLARVAQVCVEWAYLVRASETLWKCQCLAVSDQDTRQQIMQDRHKDTAPWKIVYQNNYGHRRIKRLWMDGRFSNITTLEQLPPKVHCPMDAFTWGEIFERELNR